ncbi:MAG: translocation/assembly module TamB domain-containing protein [Bacteroidaceae bacterium]|nr:translocation/assembly module TamB domain-containing protein [Bacteroidaceae bacterium]
MQKWAVDQASDWLSEEMDMQVSVERVLLKCPLDLSMNGMLALQEGDTVLNAEELALSVRFMPLFHGNVEIDDIHLKNTRLNTRSLIEACQIKGYVGLLSLVSHSTSLTDELVVLNYAVFKDADLNVFMVDSVPEDTTVSEPVNWKVDLQDVWVENVRLSLVLPMEYVATGVGTDTIDSIQHVPMSAYIGKGKLNAFLDLGKEIYKVDQLTLSHSSATYDNMVEMNELNAEIDSLQYAGTGNLGLIINQFEVNIHPKMEGVNKNYSIAITETKGRVEMDSTSLNIPYLSLQTEDSRLQMEMNMDFNAFDSISPGQFKLNTQAQIGRGDVQSAIFGFLSEAEAKDLNTTLNQYLPKKPIMAVLQAQGNMQHLEVSKLDAFVEGFANLKSTALLDNNKVTTHASIAAMGSDVKLWADYNLNNDTYKAKADIKNLVVNKFVPLDEYCTLNGNLSAEGQGFDFLSKQTFLKAKVSLPQGHYGKLNLSTIVADATLRRGELQVAFGCNNTQLQTSFDLFANLGNVIATNKGKSLKESISGTLTLDMPYADIRAMGFIDTTMVVSTAGTMDFSFANWSSSRPVFLVDSNIDAINVQTYSDTIRTTSFFLHALTTTDSTSVRFTTGDLKVNFCSPKNLFALSEQAVKFSNELDRQLNARQLDLNTIRQFMPILYVNAYAGRNNPVTPFLDFYGVKFSDFELDARTTPEYGLVGQGHVYSLQYDTIRIDTAFFDIRQDSTMLTYHSGVIADDQPVFPAFKAYVDGYLLPEEADAHLQFFDKQQKQGVDLGLHANLTDTALNVKMYPEQPVLGYRKFSLNSDNYLQLQMSPPKARGMSPEVGLMLADVRLTSLTDSCRIVLTAEPTSQGEQQANAMIENLNIKDLLTVVPFMPNMEGLFNVNAAYEVNDKQFMVLGDMSLNQFVYEGMAVGDLHSDLIYIPEGANLHHIDASLDFNKTPVATMKGSYDTTTPAGYLNADLNLTDIPLSLISPFVPDQLMGFSGYMAGNLSVKGPAEQLTFNGNVLTKDAHILSEPYSLDLRLANDTARIVDNRISFDHFKIYGAGSNPLDFNGYYDFSDFDNMYMSLSLYGYNFKLIEAKRTRKSLLFGDVYGDIMFRVHGSMSDMTIRGVINVLSKTDMTYIMEESTISQGDRLDDIVTFVDFSMPPDTTKQKPKAMGIDMNVSLKIEDGAKFNCEFSADRQSYITVRGGGGITMGYTPQGVLNVLGRITVNEGEMKYTMPVIPLKTFTIASGSYVEFTGDVMNPTLNIAATERTKASVASSGSSSRSVVFDVGMKITNTLSNMGLQFTIDAPEDGAVKEELANCTDEEKNKLAVAMLATGMYISDTNSSSGFAGNGALNNFLQSEINNLTGKALNSVVDISFGMDQTTYANGETGTDYSFKFSKRFFSDRLNVVIGGRVSDNKSVNQSTSVGSFIDDVSLEWRLDNSATRYVRLFHCKDYNNVVEGVLEKNGAGLLLRKKVDKFTDLFIFGKKKEEKEEKKN